MYGLSEAPASTVTADVTANKYAHNTNRAILIRRILDVKYVFTLQPKFLIDKPFSSVNLSYHQHSLFDQLLLLQVSLRDRSYRGVAIS